MAVELDEEQSDGCPYEFPDTYDEGHEDACAGRHAQSACRHEEAAFASAKLQRHEEEHVGEERGEGQDEHTLDVVDAWHEEQQDEHDLECRCEAAGQFEENGCEERVGILVVEGGYLPVDVVELLAMFLDEGFCPFLDKGQVAQYLHQAHGESLFVAFEKEPDGGDAEGGDGREHDGHEGAGVLGEHEEHGGDEPEPEVAEDVGHDIEDDRRRCPFGPYLGRELHDAVGLAAHESARGGVVEGKARDRDFIEPLERERFCGRLALDDDVPGGGIEDVEHGPEGEHSEKPVAGMAQPAPHLCEVELGEHHDEYDDAKDEECVLVFLFHSSFCFSVLALGMVKRTFSLSSFFS